ncbi:MAG: hypothetical protein ACXVL8_02825 [Acidimicrobiia bacterium]
MNGSTELLDWIASHDPLSICAWRDERIEAIGYDPRSDYVETFWLTVLGPSAVFTLRRCAHWLDHEDGAIEVSLELLGRSVGLGGGSGRRAPIVRTLARLAEFGLAVRDGDHYAVRRVIPPLTSRQVARLPRFLIEHHAAVMQT